ncbi:hypothetical protein [Sphingomonas sp. M1-B02]|uniref:hypothetical protein n=1 Tax=Sphingomonas sp. M1-B02 TaxID=3114300 RepID=UPI00223FEC9E|nr:hypothetical protein [Sphingomonas sp. S6-11]UZK66819.1 hypothetical protein OKW87_02980 [Sphingomonas sp. S6-11]
MKLLLAFTLLASGQETKPQPEISQARLDEMSVACRTPRKWLKHLAGEQVQFRPSPKARYEQVDCLLKQLRESAVPMKLGFVGNEQAPE